jgi:hypothetical protein
MDIRYLAEGFTGGLENICYPEGRHPHERKVTLYFDNAPIHNTRTTIGQLGQSGFTKMEHPAYSPDLAPRDFFLFGHTKEQLKQRSPAEEEEFSSMLSELVSETLPGMILRLFADWNRRPRPCLLMEGEYVE